MKKTIHVMTMILGFGAAALTLPAQEEGPPRSPNGPRPAEEHRERRMMRPMEKAAFLGVAVAPVSPSLRAQLGLPEGTGLVVQHVDDGTVSHGVLQEHDVLTRFNDQVLINPEQLTVLVRNAGIGREVTLSYLRAGEEQTAAVKLGEREVPVRGPGMPFGFGPGEGLPEWRHRNPEAFGRDMRNWAEDMRRRAEESARVFRDRMEERGEQGPERPEPREGRPAAPERPRTKPPVTRHSTWIEDGLTMNLVQSPEGKRLTVEQEGEIVFEGPVDTEEQRAAVPEEFRSKLERMEGEPAREPREQPANVL